MQAPKHPPRFLPTLTEVVKHPALAAESADTPVLLAEDAQAAVVDSTFVEPVAFVTTDAELITKVMVQLIPVLEQVVQDALQQSLQARLQALLPSVMHDVEATVSRAVADALQGVHAAQERQ
ncbi:MAG: hypothetical protein U5L73_10660 [Rhodoferax sp.]|uniref:hypothetical protein n=1 Tax=Rhodoferax sp. TaxID=50421 RepID=UPI002ACD55CF|nr:hypothetical protein [Rhodoferax sp.]MDZ7892201.1 hypothetical protein [Rhodoferax sp.]